VSGLLERLRRAADVATGGALLREAAEEIERLRARLGDRPELTTERAMELNNQMIRHWLWTEGISDGRVDFPGDQALETLLEAAAHVRDLPTEEGGPVYVHIAPRLIAAMYALHHHRGSGNDTRVAFDGVGAALVLLEREEL